MARAIVPHTGTMALEGTMTTFYRGVNKLVVTTVDGMEHVYHFTKDLVAHGRDGSGVEALESMHEGVMAVIHYTHRALRADGPRDRSRG